jgi:hypothetical protein
VPSSPRAARSCRPRRFPLPPRPIALAILLALPGLTLAGGVTATAAARLSPDEVAGLLNDGGSACAWRFLETTAATPGTWIERWRAGDCSAAGTWNLQLDVGQDGRLAVTVLLPGETRQPAAVQAAATLAVLARAADDGCRERRVVDTTVLAAEADRSVERWTVVACGQRRAYRLTFTADGAGAPGIDLEPAGAAASPATAPSR